MDARLEDRIRKRTRNKVCNIPARMTAAERRRQLIDAAAAVFSQKGFSGATTKEIAAKAQINESLLFRHFGGKETLYEAVIDEKLGGLKDSPTYRQMLEAAKRSDDEAVLTLASKTVLERYRSDRDVLRILIFSILEQRRHVVDSFRNEILPVSDLLVNYIERRTAEGAFNTDSPQLVVFGFIGMITHHATLGELVGEDQLMPGDDEALTIYIEIILNSLRKTS